MRSSAFDNCHVKFWVGVLMTAIHGGDIYRNKIQYDFSVSLNPLGCPEEMEAAIEGAATRIMEYPDPGQESVKSHIASCFGVNPENVICTNGASELFAAIVRMTDPKEALIAAPSFYGYEYALGMAQDCSIERYFLTEENDFELKADFLEKITEATDIVFLCNPNNPTGKAVDEGLLYRILEKCMHYDTCLVVDECFLELCEGAVSIKDKIFCYDRLIVAKAFTKLFGIPGVRLGFALSAAQTTERIKRQLPEWNLSVFAEAAAVSGCMILGDTFKTKDPDIIASGYIAKSLRIIQEEKSYLTGGLTELGIKVFSSDTCFILFKAREGLYEALTERGILIRDCSNFEGLDKGYYRVAVKDRQCNKALLDAIREIINGT